MVRWAHHQRPGLGNLMTDSALDLLKGGVGGCHSIAVNKSQLRLKFNIMVHNEVYVRLKAGSLMALKPWMQMEPLLVVKIEAQRLGSSVKVFAKKT